MQTTQHTFENIDNLALQRLCGTLDEHIQYLAKLMHVTIVRKEAVFSITAQPEETKHTIDALERLYQLAKKQEISTEDVHLASVSAHAKVQEANQPEQNTPNFTVLRTGKRHIQGRTLRQNHYINALQKYDIVFGIGPAGTGKTYLAVAAAVAAIENHQIERIVLVRPAVEAGEKLGFLPGDLAQKVDPYLRPLYDALYDFMGFDKVSRFLEKGLIEIAPLAYMRGRTLNNAFVILDEAQNTTQEQMKMFLTRIGFGAKAVITGDISQIDLPKNIESGLKDAINVLSGTEGIHFHYFKSDDVVRHPLVQKIVDAYDHYYPSGYQK
ncbi:PhoH family protein [Neisseria sp. Ec49-e6-T10]|uniref:PhoH family protein n=1 Tax=Neisseria sp. Ec49-e6-T10 TaxID=3140744 RepID=UPI003EBB264B